MANTNRSQSAAMESWRNETVKGQKEFNSLIGNEVKKKLP